MKLIQLFSILALLSGNFSGNYAHAAIIAVIDSGTDLTHDALKNKKWTNPIDIDDGVDNDDNGYIDDINGWNFAENNNKLIDRSFLGTFSPDVYKFFEVQTRLLKGVGTDADRDWMKAARDNTTLINELETFANFVHGTHVAGIVSKNADKAQVMVLKIMPTKRPTGGAKAQVFMNAVKAAQVTMRAGTDVKETLIKMGLKALASQQAKSLAPIGAYVGGEKARIANCSFGTSTEAVKTMILPPLLKLILRRDATPEELDMYATYFVGQIVEASVALVSPAPNTLFVIAAGNDGMNNDTSPTSPANIKVQNTISVAATLGYLKIASFSNYGEKMVEVAAPGVGIESSIPGNQYLTVSGTSQASPFVANAAGLLIDENPNLSNEDLKKILMETSDLKDFMIGKVLSGGIVNTSRAMAAAKLTKTMQIEDAVKAARVQINDVNPGFMFNEQSEGDAFVLPLPSLL